MTKSTKKKPASAKKEDRNKYIKMFWGIFGAIVLLVVLLFFMAGWGVFGPMPTFEELENPETNLATEIISSDGETLGKFYTENRTPIKYEDLPDHLVNALVATEDERFYNHAGIDAKGTVRAAVFLGSRGGASTITQQLAKQLFTDQASRNYLARGLQKIKEWIIATRLERQYTKEEIITMYFNKYDFIYQAIGIRSASNIYFGKEPWELKVEESAVLVGMLVNSAYYNPVRRPELVEQRRNVVLKQMEKNGYLSTAEKDSLQQIPMKINFTPQGHDEGVATYLREYLRGYLAEWVKNNPKKDGTNYNIYRDGLKIYTSIDSRLQKYAEEAVQAHISNLQKAFNKQNAKNPTAPFRDVTTEEINKMVERSMKNSDRWKKMKAQGKSEDEIRESFKVETEMRIFSWQGEKDTIMTPRDSIFYYKSFLNAGLMSMSPQTGDVRAWVGGINYKHFKYEHVKQAKRQVGSTFKPFVYATAIDQLHLSPCDTLPSNLHTIEAGKHGNLQDWTPKNSDNKYGGMVDLKYALAHSINTVTARLIDRTGPGPVIDLLDKLGVDTENIPKVPSIALGTPDMSVYEMVAAYSAFANEGVYVTPVVVNRIEDKNGTILYQQIPESKDVMSEETAYVTVNLMQGVTESGSGGRLKSTGGVNNPFYKEVMTGYPYEINNPVAGKTGTTQNQSDGWFIGMVPNLATGVWVGAEDRSVHFPGIRYGQGATMALPIWGMFMEKAYADEELDISKEPFRRPENLSIQTNCYNYRNSNGDSDMPELPDELDF